VACGGEAPASWGGATAGSNAMSLRGVTQLGVARGYSLVREPCKCHFSLGQPMLIRIINLGQRSLGSFHVFLRILHLLKQNVVYGCVRCHPETQKRTAKGMPSFSVCRDEMFSTSNTFVPSTSVFSVARPRTAQTRCSRSSTRVTAVFGIFDKKQVSHCSFGQNKRAS
jgi:hypothetical protein